MTQKPVLMDGAMGTLLWQEAAKAGLSKTPVWMYNLTAPELVASVHERYINAGADMILTNTFTVNALEIGKYEGYDLKEVIRTAVGIAKKAAEASGRDVKVGLDIGPLPAMLEPFGDLEEDEAKAIYKEVMDVGTACGVDAIVMETFYDLNMMAAAAETAKPYGLKVMASMTFEKSGRTFMGNTPEDVVEVLTEIGVDALGLNCSVGPKDALPVIQAFASLTDKPLILKPNAMSDMDQQEEGKLKVPYTREMYIEDLKPALPYVSYIGSCCGTDETYTKMIGELL